MVAKDWRPQAHLIDSDQVRDPIRRRVATTCVALAFMSLVGCSGLGSKDPQEPLAPDPMELLAHRISVPSEYTWGKANPTLPCATIERYVSAYDRAWWSCIEQHAENLDYRPTIGDRAGNGWPSAVDGYFDGYTAAEKRIQELRSRFGTRQTQDILKRSLEFPF